MLRAGVEQQVEVLVNEMAQLKMDTVGQVREELLLRIQARAHTHTHRDKPPVPLACLATLVWQLTGVTLLHWCGGNLGHSAALVWLQPGPLC